MMHVILGLFFIALGIWGLFDEWYYVLDYLKAAISMFLLAGGLIALVAGVMDRPVDGPEEPEEGDDELESARQPPRSDHEGSERKVHRA
jgi:hypothetical protein